MPKGTKGFSKGVSGNPGGRPKKHKITDKDRALWGKDPIKAMEWLLENADDKTELYKHAIALAQYKAPKLASVQTKVTEDKTITFSWGNVPFGNIPVVGSNKEPEAIEYDDQMKMAQQIMDDNKDVLAALAQYDRDGVNRLDQSEELLDEPENQLDYQLRKLSKKELNRVAKELISNTSPEKLQMLETYMNQGVDED
jgi:hypothetical protein